MRERVKEWLYAFVSSTIMPGADANNYFCTQVKTIVHLLPIMHGSGMEHYASMIACHLKLIYAFLRSDNVK